MTSVFIIVIYVVSAEGLKRKKKSHKNAINAVACTME